MTPYERLLAEAIPTGTFGDTHLIRRTEPTPEPVPSRWTAEEQAAHAADLDHAVAGWAYAEDTRHLTAVPAA